MFYIRPLPPIPGPYGNRRNIEGVGTGTATATITCEVDNDYSKNNKLGTDTVVCEVCGAKAVKRQLIKEEVV